MDAISIHPLTPERWTDFARLFGPQGACYGCWCTYFRIPTRQRKLLGGADKQAFMYQRVQSGPAPGLLAHEDGVPCGWVQVCPRAELPQFNSPSVVSRPLEGDAADSAVKRGCP